MVDELDARLNASSPPATGVATLGDELTALAYATERVARTRRGSRLLHFGIPALACLLVLGGASAAVASPEIRRTLGLVASTPTATPTPPPELALPFPNCHLTLVVSYAATATENEGEVASLAAAQKYLDSFDQAALLRSPAFVAKYGQPVEAHPPAGTEAAAGAALLAQMNATEEQYGITDAALSGVSAYLTSQGQNPTPMDISSGSSNCGQSK